MRAAGKKLLQTYERTNGGINGFAVAAKNQAGEEIILVARPLKTVARSAEFAGLHDVNMNMIQRVVVLPLHAMVVDEHASNLN